MKCIYNYLLLFITIVPVYGNDIIYPWRATSAIIKAGDSFEILYYNKKLSPIDSVVIKTDYFSYRLNIESITNEVIYYDYYTHKYINNTINVSVGSYVPEDLYDLFIYTDGIITKSSKSVNVIPEFNNSQKIIHISDLHVSRNWKGDSLTGYAVELELLDRFIEVANLLNPDYIIITGDNIMDYTRFDADSLGWGGVREFSLSARPSIEQKYRNLFFGSNEFNGLYGLNSPFFLTTGNHDFYGVQKENYLSKCIQWNELCGLRVYGFSYGDTRILVADDSLEDPNSFSLSKDNYSNENQGKLLEEYLIKHGNGTTRILAQHRHDAVDTQFLEQNNINILLNGHNHNPNVSYVGNLPTTVIRSGVVCRSGEIKNWENNLGYFRIIYIDDQGNVSHSDPLRFCTNPIAEYNEIDLNISSKFLNPNNGSSSFNKAIVENNFKIGFSDCKIRFIMVKGKYKVHGAKVTQVLNSEQLSIIDVSFDIESNSSLDITISPL